MLALAVGCAAPEQVSVAPKDVAAGIPVLEEIQFAELDAFDDLALVYGNDALYLGTDRAAAITLFEPRDNSVSISSLPPYFSPEFFDAFGWQTDDFAFGGIVYKSLDTDSMRIKEVVVQAMYTQEDVDDETVRAVLDRYREMYGDPGSALPGDRVAYWFWSKPGRRLMLNTAVDTRGKKSLTAAVGETQVMTLLGMDPEQAKRDKDKAIERLSANAEAG